MEKFGVKAVVRLTGVNENTLRGWERRYKAIHPLRDSDGHRSYTLEDVERIKLLWSLAKEGHPIGKIADLKNSQLKKILQRSLSPLASELNASSSKIHHYLIEMVSALEKFRLDRLNSILQKAQFEISNKDIIINLIAPLMEMVGKLVYENSLSISQEHLLSSFLRDYLGQLNQSLAPYDFASRSKSRSILLTTREGDIHEFGILMSSILCNVHRFKTYYLGPNMPLRDLISAIKQLEIEVLVLGLMRLPVDRDIVEAQDYLVELDKNLPRNIIFCLGGSAEIDLLKLRQDRVVKIIKNMNEFDLYLSELL